MDIDDRHLRFLSMDIRLKDPHFVMAELDKYQKKIAALTEEKRHPNSIKICPHPIQ